MKRHAGGALLFTSVVLGAAGARAEDTSDIHSILNEHVITTASTTAQKDSAAPALSTTITSEGDRPDRCCPTS